MSEWNMALCVDGVSYEWMEYGLMSGWRMASEGRIDYIVKDRSGSGLGFTINFFYIFLTWEIGHLA